MFSIVTLNIMLASSLSETYQESEKYLNQEGPPNADLAREHLTTLKPIIQVLHVLRILLLVLSFKYQSISQCFFYLWIIDEALESFIPTDQSI